MPTRVVAETEHSSVSPASPKLIDRVRWHIRARHYSIWTERAYTDRIRRFILFHRKRHPNEMAEPEISAFLSHLVVNKNVAASTQNQALSALLFLYHEVLGRKLAFLDQIERAKRPAKVPVVFTRAEAQKVLRNLAGDYRLMAELLYGAGLRLMDALGSALLLCLLLRAGAYRLRDRLLHAAWRVSHSPLDAHICGRDGGCRVLHSRRTPDLRVTPASVVITAGGDG
jgi:hypothetical protein